MRPGLFLTGIFLLQLGLAGAAFCQERETIRYWALGDSYTAGTGVPPDQGFPAQLVRALRAEGFSIVLSGNAGVSGAGISDVLKHQWPQMKDRPADLVTLLIGVNDWVRSTGSRHYRSRLRQLLRDLMPLLPSSRRLILMTLPDFSCAPGAARFGFGKSATNGMKRFGGMIRQIAKEYDVTLFDLYPVSRESCGRPGLFAEDGMHPSAEQYGIWVERIVPVIRGVLKKAGP